MRRVASLFACVVLWPACLAAQSPDPFTSARVHIGPFAVNPSISITNAGVDTNVFNEWQNSRSDYTATITPAADIWLRLGIARLNVKAAASYQYFARYADQRSFGTTDSVRIEVPLIHLKPWAEASFLTVRDRPGYEIDLRLRYTEATYSGGVDFPLSKRTTMRAAFKQTVTDYGADETYLGIYMRDSFNRTTTTGNATFRYALTPLTTLVMAAESVRERFVYSTIRDSDGFRLMPGVDFAASALISGTARVGFRQFRMTTPGMPDYNGLVASVDLGYTLMGVTRFAVKVSRDVAYSYVPVQPYYILTGVTGSVTQAVGGPWSVVARAGIHHLAYRTLDAATAAALGLDLEGLTDHVDSVRAYGGGVLYKLGASTRLGVNVDYINRRSPIYAQQYEGMRIGSSVTYGF